MDQPKSDQSENLLRAAADGDEASWRELVELYAPRVFGLLRANCGDPDLAEEIAQSTFCTVAGKIGQYIEEGRFESWLFRIAMNRLRDEMRRRRRQAVTTDHESLAGLAGKGRGDGATPPSTADLSDDILALRAAMQELPDADREIVHLRHFAGLSFKEIAAVLDQPLGTVLARQHRALKKLAAILGPAIGEPTESSAESTQ